MHQLSRELREEQVALARAAASPSRRAARARARSPASSWTTRSRSRGASACTSRRRAASAAAWAGHRFGAGQDRRQVHQHLGQRRGVGELSQRRAAGLEEQRAEVAVGVLDREQRAGVVVEPRQPPQVAVLGVARVVADHVHEVVEHGEHVASGSAWPAARLTAAGRRLRTTGRAATTNGRIWFWTIGAPGTASSVSAWLAAGSAPAAGSRFVAAGPSCCANACDLRERRGRLIERARQIGDRAADVLVLGGERAEHLLARVDELDDLRPAWPPARRSGAAASSPAAGGPCRAGRPPR